MTLTIGAMKQNKAGFTLVEILLVLIIMGIVVALTAPNLSKGYLRFQLNKTSDDLQSVSRWAQAMAIGQQRVYALSFADDHRSYRLVREEVIDGENDGQDNFGPVPGALGAVHTIPQAVRLDTSEDRIQFYSDGTIGPATLQLTAPGQKTVLSSMAVRGMMVKGNE